MNIGIVVEYNPFHNGHLYQINEIKKKFGENSTIIAVMSGDFVQRGEMSFLDKWEKTKIALENSVDIVVELPLYYSIQNAEIFSKMAVSILDELGTDIQVFGAEEDNIKTFYDIINLQEKDEYKKKLMEKMKEGYNYSTSQRLILEEYGYTDIVKSNNILALEYIRAINNKKSKITPFIIKREISEYSELLIKNDRKDIASATFIRNKLEKDIESIEAISQIQKFVPTATYNIIKDKKKLYNKTINIKEKIYKIFKYKLLTVSKEKIIKIYDMKEEIYARIYSGLKYANTYKNFINKTKSRNFSSKRIDRLILNTILSIETEKINFELEYIRVLGFNNKGRKLLKNIKKTENNKVFVNWKDIEQTFKNNKKIEIEKNGFLLKELFLDEKEKLNPIIKNKEEKCQY